MADGDTLTIPVDQKEGKAVRREPAFAAMLESYPGNERGSVREGMAYGRRGRVTRPETPTANQAARIGVWASGIL